MKAISLLQPWATLIMLGYKQYETRSWQTSHRGPLAIAASAGKPAWAREACAPGTDLAQLLANHDLTFDMLPRAAVLGVCAVNSMHKMDETWDLILGEVELACGDYTNGRYAWALSHVQPFATPVPCKGALSLWEVSEELERQFPLSSAPVPAISAAAANMVQIRTYRFQYGVLHLLRDGTMSDAQVADHYSHSGPLLEAWDDDMSEAEFYALPDFDDL